jgi:1-acyl-sn-glycerol-3-phosphate acyltransferase
MKNKIKQNKIKHFAQTLLGYINSLFLALHTIFWCTQMYVLFFLKIIYPFQRGKNFLNYLLIGTGQNWIRSNNLMMDVTHNIDWELPSLEALEPDQWYFIICNHQSWTDILVLQRIFLKKIPFIRFFVKKELMWLPVLNLAWWVYDFPIMHRHSKEALAKNPQLRDKDFKATQQACAKYKDNPVTILNFVEGTRFTPAKHHKQQSPFKHLLTPKAGGFAFAINVMDKKITRVLDATIAYPEGKKTFWDFLCSRVHKIKVDVKMREIPPEILAGDYLHDEGYRKQFKSWINNIWQEKDKLLDSLLL